MSYLLDTDIVIDRLNGEPVTTRLIRQLAPDGVAISIITYMEVWQGIQRRAPHWDVSSLERLLESLPVMGFSIEAARRCAAIRQLLSDQGRRVRPRALDLMTASIALEHGLAIVTCHTGDYADIPDISLYAW
jgi:tRNA(fMet)-specific endonuclease VapC